MYKWVRMKDGHLSAYHLTDDREISYWLKSVADKDGVIEDTEVVQCYAKTSC